MLRTVDVDSCITANNLAVRGTEEVPEADAETDILDHLVGIFFVNIVFESMSTWFAEFIRRNLNHVGYCGLRCKWRHTRVSDKELTRTNMMMDTCPRVTPIVNG
jgi:hypothetical protein